MVNLEDYLKQCSVNIVNMRSAGSIPKLKEILDSHSIFDVFKSSSLTAIYQSLTFHEINNPRHRISLIDYAIYMLGAIALIKTYSGKGARSSRKTQIIRKRRSLITAKYYLALNFPNEIERDKIYEIFYDSINKMARVY